MLPEYLLPVTTIRESGAGPIITLRAGGDRTFTLTLGITRIAEREGLRISVWGSADSKDWGTAPVASFTNKFYCGDYELEFDLSAHPELRYVRVLWELDAGRRGTPKPMCTISLRAHQAQRLAAAVA